jgi:predicted RNA-binding Zn-ribbon protein involved in translation (DUF1610 family)
MGTEFFMVLACIFIVVLIAIAADIYLDRFCKKCGCKMNRFYDMEEDAEVYQCPKCGRCYIINN